MKDRILIDTEDYRRIGSNLQTLSDELSDCAASLAHVMLTNEAGGKLKVNLSGALRTVSGSMPDGQVRDIVPKLHALIRQLSAYSDQLASSANQAADRFDVLERQLAAMQMSQSQEAVFSNGGGSGGGGGNPNAGSGNFDWLQHLPDIFRGENGEFQQITEYGSSLIYNPAGLAAVVIGNVHAVYDGITAGTGYITDSSEWSLGFEYDDEDKADRPRELYRNKSEGENPLKDRVALFDLSAERTASESVFHAETQLGDENDNARASVDLFKTTANGKIYAGLGATKENGEYQLAPGFGAEIGISHSVFEENISTNYELIDNVSVESNMTATAGKVDAKAEMVVGFDEQGNVNMYAGAGAEALIGEVKGDIGLDIGGVEGSIGASVNYGIGAKAEVGFHDGKFVYDVGATVGIGASVYGEVDVGGLAENVYEGLETVGSYVYDGARTVGNAVSGFCQSVCF